MSESSQAAPGPARSALPPASVGTYRPAPASAEDGGEAPRASVGEVCRTLAAVASATVRVRDDASPARRPAHAQSASQRRDELARLRAEARAAVTGLVIRLRADDVALDRVLSIVRSATRDALPGSLTPAEARAIASDALRWGAEAYAVAD